MRLKVTLGVCLLAFSTLLQGAAWAYDCTGGGQQVYTTGVLKWATDSTGARAVYLEAETGRSVEDEQNCPGWVRVEGWIWGDALGAASNQSANIARLGNLGSFAPLMIISCAAGTYSAKTKHFFIYDGWLGDPWYSLGEKDPQASVPECPPPPDDPPPPPEDPTLPLNGSGCPTCNSPLLVDVDHDGFRLTNAADGVLFDLDGDGIAERVAWTEPDSDDGWLAFDRNGNGRIDDGSELIGNHTRAYADNPAVRATNGFEALKFMEGPTYGRSVPDGVIDARDGIYTRLLLWRDRNHNGISEPDELQPLAGSGLFAIQTDYQAAGRRDRFGNEFRQRAKGVWTDGEHYIYDVWLTQER